jgi:uncharacterized protein YegP (UPF0339 family)
MKNPKYQIFKSEKDNQFYFRLRAGNGEIILQSEGYTSKQNCENGIESVRRHSPYDQNYNRKDITGNYTFSLEANNGEIIGIGESYTTRQAREDGITSVKNNGPKSPVEDLT